MSKLVPDKTLEKVFQGAVFSEGPASDRNGGILFSDCSENIIYRFDEVSGETSIWSNDSRHANGMNFDAQGRLVVCCDGKSYPSSGREGAHAVRRYEKDGSISTLADSYRGKKLNGPNDLCFDSKGVIYFTDPRYGDKSDIEQEVMAVYKIDLDGTLTRVVDHNLEDNGQRTLVRYKVDSNGSWKKDKVLLDFKDDYGMDGMVLDQDENIYVTGGSGKNAGVHIVSREGDYIDLIPTPEVPGNCTFGGPDLDILYICATSSLYRVKINAKGLLTCM
jgi:gluconolactonase